MMEQPLSITNVLRFANHDFVNHLHLIRMNLDLGNVEEAKKIIFNISEEYRQFSNMNQLHLPKTIEWLLTSRWRFPALQISIDSNVEKRVNADVDDALVQYLENTVIHVYDELDPFTEQNLNVKIQSDENKFKLEFNLQGLWNIGEFQQNEGKNLDVQTIEETNTSWIYVLSMIQE